MPAENFVYLPTNAQQLKRKAGTKRQWQLAEAVRHWPTPTAKGNYNRKGLSPASGDGLITAVRREKDSRGLPLNPQWVCALMGYPPDWTTVGR